MRFLILTLIFAAGLVPAAADAPLRFDLRGDFQGWNSRNFYQDNRFAVTPDDGGVILAPRDRGAIAATCFTFFPRPAAENATIAVSLRYRAEPGTIPLTVCLSRGPGAGSPAVKHPIRILANGQWHETRVEFDLAPYHALQLPELCLEFIMEGAATTDRWQISEITITPEKPAPVEFRRLPASGNIATGYGAEEAVVAVAANAARQVKAELRNDNDGGSLLETREEALTAGGRTEFRFDMAERRPGNYRVELFVDGVRSAEYPFLKFVPGPDSVIVAGGVPHYRGEPLFVIGLFHASDPVLSIVNDTNRTLGLPPVERSAMLEELRRRRFNTVHHSWTPGSPEFHRDAAAAGLLVLNEIGRDEPAEAYQRVAAVMNEPNLLGWSPFDEPQAGWRETAATLYDKYSRMDPHHPVIVAFEAGGYGLGSRPLADVAMEDFYHIGSSDCDLGVTGELMAAVERNIVAGNPGGCLFLVPQLFRAGESGHSCFQPTPAQVRAQVALGLIHGAKGLMYYAFFTTETTESGMERNPARKYWYLPESSLWDAIGDINAQVEADAEFFLLGEAVPGVRFDGLPEARAWRLGDRMLILAVNTSGSRTQTGRVILPESADLEVSLPPYGVFRRVF